MLISRVIERLRRRILWQGRKVNRIGAGRIGPLDACGRNGCIALVAYGRTNRHENGRAGAVARDWPLGPLQEPKIPISPNIPCAERAWHALRA